MSTYIALFQDDRSMIFECIFHALNDANAIIIAEQMNAQSKCALFELMKTETIGTYVGTPDVNSSGFAKGVCFYYYSMGAVRDLIKFAVLDPKFVSAGNPKIIVEPFAISLVGKVTTEESNPATEFSRAIYNFRQPLT